MSKKKHKKSSNEDKNLKIIILVTATLNLIKTAIDIVKSIID